MLTLIIGGARSGKSRFAQTLSVGPRIVYLATGNPSDAEMADRIARHRRDRPTHWLTIEEPLEIASAVERHAPQCDCLLIDCLTLWLSNLSWEHRDSAADTLHQCAAAQLARISAASAACHVVIVTNELGCGLVPESPLARAFRDLQGWMNQEVARAADCVYHVVAGIPVAIKKP